MPGGLAASLQAMPLPSSAIHAESAAADDTAVRFRTSTNAAGQLVLMVALPEVAGISEVDLQASAADILVAVPRCGISLQYPLAQGAPKDIVAAKFSKKKQVLTITLA